MLLQCLHSFLQHDRLRFLRYALDYKLSNHTKIVFASWRTAN
jgi:hypothetical protein